MRNINDIADGGAGEWPSNGWHKCEAVDAKLVAPMTGTVHVRVTWAWDGGEFVEKVYASAKTVSRLARIVRNVIQPTEVVTVPDDDNDAAQALAEYIERNISGCTAMVEVKETPGRDGVLRKQVSFGGHRPVEQSRPAPATAAPAPTAPAPTNTTDEDNLPF